MQKSVSWRLLSLALSLAILTCTLPLPAVQAAPDGTEAIEVVVRTPDYELTETGVSVASYATEDVPGMPMLPVYGTLVELPAAGDWEVSYQSAASRVLEQRVTVRSAPAPDPSMTGLENWTQLPNEELPTAVLTIDRPDPDVYGTNAFYPASPIASKEVVWQEGRRLLPLRVYPFQYNPVTGELRYHPEIRIQIEVKASASTLQPEAAPVAAIVAAPQAVAGTGGTLRIRTTAAGMHRLTYDDLNAKGVPLATTDVATFAMTYLGLPVDIQIVGNGNNRLESGELVVFYAEGYSGRYGKENVYFFSYGGPAGARMAARTVTRSGPTLTTIIRTARAEFDRVYYSTYPAAQNADHFFDAQFLVSASNPVSTTTYSLNLVDPVTTGTIAFRGRFYGGTAQAAVNPDQWMQVSLNGKSPALGTFTWDGQTAYDATATASASLLTSTANTLKLEAAQQLPSLPSYKVYVDWVELDYPALATAQADRLYIKGLNLTGTSVQVETTGFTTSQVMVYDVRDPRHPVVIGGTLATGAGAPYKLTFWDTWAAGAPAPSYFLTTQAALISPATLVAPAAVEIASLPAWNTAANNYDYIAIVHRSLWDAIQPLLTYRAAQGLRVAKVDVQDVYDAYSGGLVDPEAIRSFLAYAYRNWNGGGGATRPPAPPKYVLLVGDGHYDFKNVTLTQRTPATFQPNLIPPYLIRIDPWIGETAADNRYVSVDGSSDFMPDMAIGRIPARTAAEVTAVVNKIRAYENPAVTLDGAWQNMITFVAGRANDPAGDFQYMSDRTRLNFLPATVSNRTVYWTTDYIYAYPQNGTPNMNDAIKAAFRDSIMLQWFGHAGRFIWSGSSSSTEQVFSSFSITGSTVPNSPQWPFSADYSCWSGYFMNLDNFSGDYRSLAEAALLDPTRGAIAASAPSGLHSGAALITLNQGLVKAVFQDRIQPAGAAMNAAKAYYYANAGTSFDVMDTTIFFGDPALTLRLPPGSAAAPGLSVGKNGTAASLSWTNQSHFQSYDLWRGLTPYFDPNVVGSLVATVSASSASQGATITVDDNGTTPPPTVQIIGDPAQNYFWVIRGRSSDGVSAPSNRTGEFDFQLVPGN